MGDCSTRRQASDILQTIVGGGDTQHLNEYTNKGELLAADAKAEPLNKYKSNNELVNIEDIQKAGIDFPIYFVVKLVGDALYFSGKNVGVYFDFDIQFIDNVGQRHIQSFSSTAIITSNSGSIFQQIFRVVYNTTSSNVNKFIGINIQSVTINITSPNNYPKTAGQFICQYNSSDIINTNIGFVGPVANVSSSIDVGKENSGNPIWLICKIKTMQT